MNLTKEELWTTWFWFKYCHRYDLSLIQKEDLPLAQKICKELGIECADFEGKLITAD